MQAVRIIEDTVQGPRARAREPGGLTLEGAFLLELGASLTDVRVAYSLVGPPGAPVIAVLGGISADRHVVVGPGGRPGWWAGLFGAGRAVSTDRFQVLAFDFLGGNGRTMGPRDPCAPTPFPEITTLDQARILAKLLEALAIPRLHAFVGASYGGMIALAFAQLFPMQVERLVVISAAHVSAPLGTAWRTIQRRIVALAASKGCVEEGLALARALAMTTYRTPEELNQRFEGPRAEGLDPDAFPVWQYLEARGADYVRSMDPAAFVTLSRSIDLHAVEPERITVPLCLVSVRQDRNVPASLSEALAARAGGPCELVSLDSLYGHDAFLKEEAFFSELLRRIEL